MTVQLKRAYDPPSKSDGTRILVDRLWPRGLTKAKARIDLWLKEIAPSNELRKSFHSAGMEWKDFRRRYLAELKKHQPELEILRNKARAGTVTLIFSSHDREQNQAIILKKLLTSDL